MIKEFEHPEHCWKWTTSEVEYLNKLFAAKDAEIERQDLEYVNVGLQLIDMERERDSLQAEIERLQREVVNRNQRALDGDKAQAAFNSMYDEAEALRAENQKLRDALTICADRNMASGLVKQTALAALGEKT